MPKRSLIALTGAIASGKSTVLKLFADADIATVNIDLWVKELYNEDSPIFNDLKLLLADYYDGSFDFAAIRQAVIASKELDDELKALLYPSLRARLKALSGQWVVEMPLIFEAGMEDLFTYIIYVDAPSELIKKNLIKRNFSLADRDGLEKRMLSPLQRKERSHFVWKNNGDLAYLAGQVAEFIEDYLT